MEQDLDQLIKEDIDNIVFLFPLKSQDKLAAACYNRNNLIQVPICYQCTKENSMDPLTFVLMSMRFFFVFFIVKETP